jgi:cyclopropane-fatty-acyl-phospholipid synthase
MDWTTILYDRLIKPGNHVSTGRCYDLMQELWTVSMPASPDLTEGLYEGDVARSYEDAQRRKRQFLLDSANVGRGSRAFDVGCGHGTLLQDIAGRGALGMGITLSEKQAAYCARQGLSVAVRNWKALGDAWDAQFDAVIASGSLEHFVSPRDHKTADTTYRAFFRKCHELLDPASSAPRVVVTTCVFHRRFSRQDGPWKKHLLNLGYFMDGCYPKSPESLIACSEPWFRVVERRDATEDYLRTSRFWKEKLVDTWTPKKALTFGRLIAQNAHHPLDVVMALKFFRDQSWIWQFEGADPPVRLLQLVLEPTERRAAERQNTDRRSAHLTA